MPRIWVSIGSNIERESHVRAALVELRALFGDLIVSPVYEAQAVGFDGPPFFNLVVGLDSELPPATLHGLMREIEAGTVRAVLAYRQDRAGWRVLLPLAELNRDMPAPLPDSPELCVELSLAGDGR